MSPRCWRLPGGSAKAPGGQPPSAALPGCGGNAPGGRSGNESTSVGPVLPMWVALSAASSASSDRIRPIDAGRGAPAAFERRRDRPRKPRSRDEPLDAVAPLDVDAPRTQVEAAHGLILPGRRAWQGACAWQSRIRVDPVVNVRGAHVGDTQEPDPHRFSTRNVRGRHKTDAGDAKTCVARTTGAPARRGRGPATSGLLVAGRPAATRAPRPCSAGRRRAGGTCPAAARRTPRGCARRRAA